MRPERCEVLAILLRALAWLPACLAAWYFASPVLSWIPARLAAPAVAAFSGPTNRLELTAESVVEALEVGELAIRECRDRFLPYTTKSRLSSFYWLVPLYLRLPFAWRIFGAQAFIVAEKTA